MRDVREAGFSLIELIVVLVLLGILAAAIAPNLVKRGGQMKNKAGDVALSTIEGSLDLFFFDVGRYPTNQEGLEALLENPQVENWQGPYLKKSSALKDPWGKPFQY